MDPISPVKDEDLECLIFWPRGSRGWMEDRAILLYLNRFCKERGYGALQQMMQDLWELWNDPAKKEAFTERRKKWLANMREYWGNEKIPEED